MQYFGSYGKYEMTFVFRVQCDPGSRSSQNVEVDTACLMLSTFKHEVRIFLLQVTLCSVKVD